MKTESLRKKNIINFTISVILLAIFCGATFYNIRQNDTLQSRVDSIQNDTRQIKNQTTELQSKTIEIKKYKELWRNVAENKKTMVTNIKADDVNAKLSSIADKYSISNPVAKITLPEQLVGGLFDRVTMNVFLTRISLTFDSLDDSRALGFINEFSNSMPGYILITEFNILRDKSYSSQDLVAISQGKGVGIIKGKAELIWYAYKSKEPIKPIEEKK